MQPLPRHQARVKQVKKMKLDPAHNQQVRSSKGAKQNSVARIIQALKSAKPGAM